MSQPECITAKIYMSEENYKKYLRKVSSVIANEVYHCIANEYRDYFIFKYLKKENALYAYFFFYYGDSQHILNHPLLDALKEIENYLETENSGYITANRDALNCHQDDFVFASVIKNKQIVPHTFSKKELDIISNDYTIFYKLSKTDFNIAVHSKPIIDKAIIKKVNVLQEQHRVEMLKNNLHTATLENPIELYKNYFYNGKFYTCMNDSVIVFDAVNLKELYPTPYGLRDDKGVIVRNKYIATSDSKNFKRLQKGETIYFTSSETVYNSELENLPNSDGASFKLKSEYVAEDKMHIYFVGKQYLKTIIGEDYKVNSCGYYYGNILLYSSKMVLAGETILENIDAASFEILSPDSRLFQKTHNIPSLSTTTGGAFILHCKDENGEFIIHNYKNKTKTLQVERITSLNEYINDTIETISKLNSAHIRSFIPEFRGENYSEYFGKMNIWIPEYLDTEYKKNPYSKHLHSVFNNYIYSCFQLYQQSNAKTYLEKAIALFDKAA
jgi:hypothetical protein